MADDDDPRSIALHTERSVDGSTVISVVDGWPKRALFDPAVLQSASPDMLVVDGNRITIRLANGFASYIKRKQTGPHGHWVCSIGESEYISPERMAEHKRRGLIDA